MKSMQPTSSFSGGIVALFCLFVFPLHFAHAANTQYVQVRTAKLRAAPKSYSKALVSLKYQDPVEELEEEDGWIKASAKGKTGYIHESALSTKRIVSSTKKVSALASDEDLVLAGKGFSSTVEKQYKKQNPNKKAAFTALDRLEKTYMNWNPSIASFRKAGKLKEGRG